MAMRFCEKCNSILQVIKIGDEKYFICLRCKSKKKCYSDENTLITENFNRKKTGIGTAENKDMSGYDFKCLKCGNDKCKVTDLGIMYGDEDWIYLLKCTKCDYAERVGEMG